MPIAESKIRTNIILTRELKNKLEELAKADNRSMNNYIVTVLQEHVEAVAPADDHK